MRYGVLLLSTLVVACGKDAAGPLPDEPGNPTDVAGTWTYFEHISNVNLQLTCDDQGTLAITENAHDLSGSVNQTGFCTAPGGGGDNSGTCSFTGNVGAATVRLDITGCAYHGALFNTPRDSANGTVSCRGNLGAPVGTVTLTGTWLEGKGAGLAPPTVSAGVIIAPGDTLAVTGETVRISIAASDDRRLGWVGYRVGAPANVRDSVPVTAASYADTIDLVVPAAWAGA